MTVITISRQYGSQGDEIAVRVSERLGYRYFDKQLMAQVASEMGLAETEIIDFSEDDYKMQGFLARLLGRLSPRVVDEVGAGAEDADAVVTKEMTQLDEERYVGIVRRTIEAAYELGNVVVVGRGGQAILRNKRGVLHVRLEAPVEARITRIRYQEASGLTPDFEHQAAKEKVTERDRSTAAYLKRFYGIDASDPKLYHLVLDTERWGIVRAACLIANAVDCL